MKQDTQRPLFRVMDPKTSRDAAGRCAGDHRVATICLHLFATAAHPMTDEELCDAYVVHIDGSELPPEYTDSRIRHGRLYCHDQGWIEMEGRRTTRSGASARAFVITPAGRAKDAEANDSLGEPA
jgi:hypothetical protein